MKGTVLFFILFFFFKQKTAYEIYQCDWSSDVCSSDLITKFFNVTIPADLKDTINSIKEEYGFNTISAFEIQRDNKRKKFIAESEKKYIKDTTLAIRLENMSFRFNPRNIVPSKNLGTIYPNMRITDNWGTLTVEKGALLGKNWHIVIVSKPTEITDTIIKGDGWKLELNKSWKLIKTGKNYTLKKK